MKVLLSGPTVVVNIKPCRRFNDTVPAKRLLSARQFIKDRAPFLPMKEGRVQCEVRLTLEQRIRNAKVGSSTLLTGTNKDKG